MRELITSDLRKNLRSLSMLCESLHHTW